MHREVATRSPLSDRVVMDAQELGRLGGVQVLRQFGHGLGLRNFWSERGDGYSLTNPTWFEHNAACLGEFGQPGANHGNSSRFVARDRLRCCEVHGWLL